MCEKREELFSVFDDNLMDFYRSWREEQSRANEIFPFWDIFIQTDFMSYLGLFYFNTHTSSLFFFKEIDMVYFMLLIGTSTSE